MQIICSAKFFFTISMQQLFQVLQKVAQCDKKTFSVCFGYYVSMSRQYDYFPKGQVNFYSLKVMYSRSLNLHFIIKT